MKRKFQFKELPLLVLPDLVSYQNRKWRQEVSVYGLIIIISAVAAYLLFITAINTHIHTYTVYTYIFSRMANSYEEQYLVYDKPLQHCSNSIALFAFCLIKRDEMFPFSIPVTAHCLECYSSVFFALTFTLLPALNLRTVIRHQIFMLPFCTTLRL